MRSLLRPPILGMVLTALLSFWTAPGPGSVAMAQDLASGHLEWGGNAGQRFRNVYEEAYRLGLKGCTTFRPNAVTGSILSARTEEDKSCPSCGSFDMTAREGCTTCLSCGFAVCG